MPPRMQPNRVVYFARRESDGVIKIGTSIAVETRLAALEYRDNSDYTLLATMPGGYAAERVVHERFKAFRVEGRECFSPAPELLAFVAHPELPPAGDGALAKWIAEHETTASAFAKRVGIDAAALSRILYGGIIPRRSTARRIELATKGAVAVSGWPGRKPFWNPSRRGRTYLGAGIKDVAAALRIGPHFVGLLIDKERTPSLEMVRRLVDAFPQITAQMVLDYHCPPPAQSATEAA